MSVFCPNCGARNSEADTNCQKCGFNLKEQAGAKFKGTMLMMNNASAMAAELRRSAPPGAANPPGNPPGNPPAGPAQPQKTSLSPDSAKQMRAQLKGTMIGVAPPALGANRPPGGAPGVAVPRPSSRPPMAPMGAGPRQPGPGQVNAPGAGAQRGGSTIIGTGIAPTGFPRPPSGTPLPPPATSSMTEAIPLTAEPFGSAARALSDIPQSPQPTPAFDVTHVSPNTAASPAAGIPGTQAMNSFESFPSQDPALSGTLVAGSAAAGPATNPSFTSQPQFGQDAGKRTNTPAMGMPEAYAPTAPAPAPVSEPPDIERYANKPSKGMELTLTVLTCGLYLAYKKFMAKNG